MNRKLMTLLSLVVVAEFTGAGELPLTGWHGSNEACNWAPGKGVDGGKAMGIVGKVGKSDRYYSWSTDALEFKPNRVYGLSFQVNRERSGSEILVRNDFYNLLRNDVVPGWVTLRAVMRAPKNGATCPIALSDYNAQAHTYFDRVRLVELTPEYRTEGGVTLGRGEVLAGRHYYFTTQRHCEAGADSRPLKSIVGTAAGDKYQFVPGSEVNYCFQVANRRFLNARGMLTSVHGTDCAVEVEASADATSWTRLAVVTNGNPYALEFPAAFFPAEQVHLRLRSASSMKKGSLCQIETINFDGEVDGEPLYLAGATTYFERGGRKAFLIEDNHQFRVASPGETLADSSVAAIWGASSAHKLFRDTRVPTRRGAALKVAAAAGETESVQLAVSPRADLEDARVKPVKELRGDNGAVIPASAIEVLRVGYVDVRIVTDKVGLPGLWPDPLPPQDRNALPVKAGETQPFWINVRVPRGTPKGVYRGELAVRTIAGGVSEITRVPFETEVFGFELPERMTLKTMFGFHPHTVYDYHKARTSEDRERIREMYVKCLAEHHVTPYYWSSDYFPRESFVNADDPEKASVELDFTDWDREMHMVIDKYHGNVVKLGPKGLGGGNHDKRTAAKFGPAAYGTPLYDKLMKEYLGKIESHLREKGWLDYAFVYWFDEPSGTDYDYVNEGMATVRKYAPGLRRMITNLCAKELMPTINTWCPTVEMLHVPMEKACRERGDTMWWYICCSPRDAPIGEHIDHPGVDMRLWPWQAWGEKITGMLVWASEWWTAKAGYPDPAHPQDPYLDPMGWNKKFNPNRNVASWCNGEGRYFYPPLACKDAQQPETCYDPPVSCIRLELLRDGIEDYEYLAMLSRKAEGHDLLKVPEAVYRTLFDYSKDPRGMESQRLLVAREPERR